MVIVDLLERSEPRGVAVEELEDGPTADSAVEFALLELLLQAPQQQAVKTFGDKALRKFYVHVIQWQVGCGAGNTIFHLVATYHKLYVHACDISPHAIEIVKRFQVLSSICGILDAYRTGRGQITVRGKTDVELVDSKTKRMAVIIKEVVILVLSKGLHQMCIIPYQTNKSSLVEKIAELVENKVFPYKSNSIKTWHGIVCVDADVSMALAREERLVYASMVYLDQSLEGFLRGRGNWLRSLDGISDIRDESDRSGMRIVIEAFLDFRCSVVERRARFKLSQMQERKHTVEGIKTGLDNMDRVIQIIREASSNATASASLRNGKLPLHHISLHIASLMVYLDPRALIH
ncbi:hypothetical protein Q3G72_020108 [Acer saccharum]|nr:hypothetical protein Q3G72_020108 [Acer saccharum]